LYNAQHVICETRAPAITSRYARDMRYTSERKGKESTVPA